MLIVYYEHTQYIKSISKRRNASSLYLIILNKLSYLFNVIAYYYNDKSLAFRLYVKIYCFIILILLYLQSMQCLSVGTLTLEVLLTLNFCTFIF